MVKPEVFSHAAMPIMAARPMSRRTIAAKSSPRNGCWLKLRTVWPRRSHGAGSDRCSINWRAIERRESSEPRRNYLRVDKAWSLTDCISFVVMREHEITDALTGDRHFTQAGFNALLV
jgi:hypothetical protein